MDQKSREYSDTDLANVQNYLMWKGHACPTIVNDEVHFIDQTKGRHRFGQKCKIDDILEEIRVLKRVPVEHYSEKASFQSGSARYGVGFYQVFDCNNKLLYVEDLKIEFRGLY
jgi:hypothetical protein